MTEDDLILILFADGGALLVNTEIPSVVETFDWKDRPLPQLEAAQRWLERHRAELAAPVEAIA